MYNIQRAFRRTAIRDNQTKEGEMLETKIERMVSNKEKMKGEAPLIYTERKKGVIPSTDIRTDRWEIAIDASTKIEKSYKARREERAAKKAAIGEPEPTQGKVETTTDNK